MKIRITWHIGCAGEVCANNVEYTIMVPNGRGVYATREYFSARCVVYLCCCLIEGDLRGPIYSVSYQFPVDQILGLVNGDAGEELEAGVGHVEDIPYADT